MAKYKIDIYEILFKTVEVEAEDSDEAEKMVVENYKRAKDGYVLNADNHILTHFCELGESEPFLKSRCKNERTRIKSGTKNKASKLN